MLNWEMILKVNIKLKRAVCSMNSDKLFKAPAKPFNESFYAIKIFNYARQ